jgi:hypothetical protein
LVTPLLCHCASEQPGDGAGSVSVLSAERRVPVNARARDWTSEFGLPVESDVYATFDVGPNVYHLTCSDSHPLRKASGEPWRDEIPECGGDPYFFGSEYVPNKWQLGCLGCDYVGCEPFPDSTAYRTWDFVRTGTRLPPEELIGAAGAAGTAGGEGGAAGAVVEPVPVVEPVHVSGPFTIQITYYANRTCHWPSITTDPFVVDIE